MPIKIHTTYTSVWDVADAAEGECHLKDSKRASRRRYDDKWTMTKSFDEAVNLLRNGWREGFDYMIDMGDLPLQDVLTEETYYDVAGRYFDVGMLVTGEPEHWVNEQIPDQRSIDITVNSSFSASVNSKAILQRCLVVANIADILCKMGVIVTIKSYCSVSVGDNTVLTEFVVKKGGEPLDLYNMSFMLGHPSLLRRISFSLWECMGKEVVDTFGFHNGAGYGYPHDIPEEMEGDIHFSKVLSKNAVSAKTLAKHVKENLRKVGIEWQ